MSFNTTPRPTWKVCKRYDNLALLEDEIEGEILNEIFCVNRDEAECLVDLLNGKERELTEKTNEVARLREENDALKQGKVFVDPKWIYDLETQLAKSHEELCQAGLREYGN